MSGARAIQRKFASTIGFEANTRVAFYRVPDMQRADVGKSGRVPKPAQAFRPEGLPPETFHDDDPAYGSGKICCPACQWQPDKYSRWFCISMGPPENFSGGCGNGWNTFDTRGVCPGCQHHWRHTTCLSCSVTSLHDDWYASPGTGRKP
jgi:hypothetical protein